MGQDLALLAQVSDTGSPSPYDAAKGALVLTGFSEMQLFRKMLEHRGNPA